MKKSLQLLLAAFCFAIMLFCISEPVTAAPAINKDAQRPKATVNKAQNRPIAECYQNKGEVWPPAPGRYERKNPNGLCNAYLNVTVLPDQWPVINLHACEYNGPNDEHGWEALDTNPGIWLGGRFHAACADGSGSTFYYWCKNDWHVQGKRNPGSAAKPKSLFA